MQHLIIDILNDTHPDTIIFGKKYYTESTVKTIAEEYGKIISRRINESYLNKSMQKSIENIVKRVKTELTISTDQMLTIAATIAANMDIPIDDLISGKRKRNLVIARAIFYVAAKWLLRISISDIAEFMNGKNHATVLHSFKVHTSRYWAGNDIERFIQEHWDVDFNIDRFNEEYYLFGLNDKENALWKN